MIFIFFHVQILSKGAQTCTMVLEIPSRKMTLAQVHSGGNNPDARSHISQFSATLSEGAFFICTACARLRQMQSLRATSHRRQIFNLRVSGGAIKYFALRLILRTSKEWILDGVDVHITGGGIAAMPSRKHTCVSVVKIRTYL